MQLDSVGSVGNAATIIAALPRHLAVATLAARLADLTRAALVLAEPARFER